MRRCNLSVSLLGCTAVFFLVAAFVPAYGADKSASGQLKSFGNTGTVFDGSDGKRFGTDTKVNTNTGNVPDVGKPQPVSTSTGTAGGYSVGGSTTTAQGTSTPTNSGKTDKKGSEKAN